MKQVPVIRQNELTGGWACITKYKIRANGNVIEAIEKWDVTQQIKEIISLSRKRKKNRRQP
jgi:hypothetical protein